MGGWKIKIKINIHEKEKRRHSNAYTRRVSVIMKLGSLFSITLSSLAVTNQVAIVRAASCEGKEEVKTKIDFFDADLIENTLHHPDKSGRLRYENVGLFKGDSIDLVVTQNPDAPPYSTDMW